PLWAKRMIFMAMSCVGSVFVVMSIQPADGPRHRCFCIWNLEVLGRDPAVIAGRGEVVERCRNVPASISDGFAVAVADMVMPEQIAGRGKAVAVGFSLYGDMGEIQHQSDVCALNGAHEAGRFS